jgi:hypothetical protein
MEMNCNGAVGTLMKMLAHLELVPWSQLYPSPDEEPDAIKVRTP